MDDEEVFSQYLKTMNIPAGHLAPAGKMRTFSAVTKEIPARAFSMEKNNFPVTSVLINEEIEDIFVWFEDYICPFVKSLIDFIGSQIRDIFADICEYN